ncbi:ATP-dependent nuclease [Rubrivirga marina]|nr:AAA family ATPase [Rubrivirga marina]
MNALYVHNPGRNVHHTRFLDLGKVSVLCGRNNSGKTTLLESVRDIGMNGSAALGSPAIRLEGEFAEALWRQVENECKVNNWSFSSAKDQIERAWGGDLLDLEKQREVVERIGAFRGYSNLQKAVENAVATALKKLPKRVLVPAKRLRLQQAAFKSEPSGELNPRGENLLNYLFWSKNQVQGSRPYSYYGELRGHFSTVTEGFDFDVTLSGGSLTLKILPPFGGKWDAAESFGLGLHDVLLILAVALAEDAGLLLVEEPENHVHPAMQRRLLQVLKRETTNQYLLSTHSNVFLDNAFVDKVYFTEFVDGEVRLSDVTSKASLLDDLGYEVTDNLTADVVVLVEGPTDVPVLETLALRREDLRLKQIKFWPLGGDIMDQLDLSVLTDSNKVVAIVDDDPGSRRVRDRFLAKCAELEVRCHRLGRYAIENYFTVDALRSVYGGQLPEDVTRITPRTKLEKQIGFNVKRRNRDIAEAMSYEDVAGTDLGDFFDLLAEVAR